MVVRQREPYPARGKIVKEQGQAHRGSFLVLAGHIPLLAGSGVSLFSGLHALLQEKLMNQATPDKAEEDPFNNKFLSVHLLRRVRRVVWP